MLAKYIIRKGFHIRSYDFTDTYGMIRTNRIRLEEIVIPNNATEWNVIIFLQQLWRRKRSFRRFSVYIPCDQFNLRGENYSTLLNIIHRIFSCCFSR